MRLDKLTIGSDKKSLTHQFKNLKNVTIDFDQGHWVTVVIGWNGTGKSNVLEALAIIFRDLIAKERTPAFAFQLHYRMGTGEAMRHIHIDSDPDRTKEPIRIHVANAQAIRHNALSAPPQPSGAGRDTSPYGEPLKLNTFLNADAEYLPRYVFSYYSGESRRMHDVFEDYLKKYYGELLKSTLDPEPKRLFYALPVHSQFVLLAFLIRPDQTVRDFLLKELDIDPENGVESVLFVLREPPWSSGTGDPRFWNARGLVQRFLDRLMRVSLAPIAIKRRLPKSIWNKNASWHEYKYVFVKDVEALRELVGDQSSNEFFRDLESTYVSELIEEVRIRVRLKQSDGTVTFRELSEGEQQLLTVLGLLRFTAKDESLFLLDEPDTHLNPRWCVDYISYLRKFIASGANKEETSHVLLTTHNPLAIAELEREQVQILRMLKEDDKRRVVACYPEMAPKGMGYAAIVTSDMFGIASTLDESTQLLLEKQRAFAAKLKLTADEQLELDRVNEELSRLGFRFFHPDDEFSRYLRLRDEALKARFATGDPAELARHAVAMNREEREELAGRLIENLLADERAGK